MTPAQRLRIDEVFNDNRRAEQAAFQRFQDRFASHPPPPAPDGTQAFPRQFQEEFDGLGCRAEAAMLKVLDDRQRTRLDQIHLQADGPSALSCAGWSGSVSTSIRSRSRRSRPSLCRAGNR